MHADPAMAPGYDEWGGTHTYMKELLDEFESKHIYAILVTRKSMRYLPNIEQYNKYCTIYRLQNGDNEPMNKTRLKEFHRQNVEKIYGIITEQESLPHIIHSVYWNSGRIAMELSSRIGVPFVHSIISNSRGRVSRGAFEPVKERSSYEQKIYETAKKLICVSNDEANDLIKLYGINPQKIVIAGQYIHQSFINPSHDLNGFPRLNSNISIEIQQKISNLYNKSLNINGTDYFWIRKPFIYIGRIDKNKGLQYILKAWYNLYIKYDQECPSLWLVGGSICEIEEIRESIKADIPILNQLEHIEKIIWWGCLDPTGLSTVLLKSGVLITHSLYEPGGRVAIEAMAESVPVIATPNGFGKDSIKDWENGFLVEFGDIPTLTLRMEHFIRQPYLSNSLGLCARETAMNTIKSWDFINKHLNCYFNKQDTVLTYINHNNYFKQRIINLYPAYNLPYSDDLILKFVSNYINDDIISIEKNKSNEKTSDIYFIRTKKENYVIKRTASRLAISPLYNPICKDAYIRRADKMFNTEITAYIKSGSKIILGYDDFHFLILLKQGHAYRLNNVNQVLNCIEVILSYNIKLSEEENNTYLAIIENESLTLDQKINKLNSEFNYFFFDPSGIFSNVICWRNAHNLIDYNKDAFSSDMFEKLSYITDFFYSKSVEDNNEKICGVNTDIYSNHIISIDNSIEIIDREKTCIGIPEAGISGIVYDFALNNDYLIGELLLKLKSNKNIDYKALIINTAFRFFLEIVINNLFYRIDSKKELELIYLLIEFYN